MVTRRVSAVRGPDAVHDGDGQHDQDDGVVEAPAGRAPVVALAAGLALIAVAVRRARCSSAGTSTHATTTRRSRPLHGFVDVKVGVGTRAGAC